MISQLLTQEEFDDYTFGNDLHGLDITKFKFAAIQTCPDCCADLLITVHETGYMGLKLLKHKV